MLNSSASVVVNVLVNASTAQAGVTQVNNILLQISITARIVANQSANAFNSIFGANFFANLASSMVQSMAGGFTQIVQDAVNAASKLESALMGVGSTAKNLGLSQGDVVETVRNLDLVKTGLLNVGDAATAMKNLLQSGFSVPQAVDIIRRFGDTAAFGRQAALSFGQAISSATEGIKNQNSILVDNAGVTKNLSVILKERGFQIQDLSDKTKGAAAREALYQGLIKETSVQIGDADKLLNTTQGSLLRADAAWQRFLASMGQVVTQSDTVKAAFSGIVAVLDFMSNHTGTVIALAAAFGLMTAAVALSATGFTSLTLAQVGNAAATAFLNGLVYKAIAALFDYQVALTITAGEIVVLTGGIAALAIVIGVIVAAIFSYNSATTETVKLTQESISQMVQQKASYESQVQVLQSLTSENANLASNQAIVQAAYRGVNLEAQARVVTATDEAEKVRILTAEYIRLRDAQNAKLGTTSRLAVEDIFKQMNTLESQTEAQKRAGSFIDAAPSIREQANQRIRESGFQEAGALPPEFEYNLSKAKEAFKTLEGEMNTTRGSINDLRAQMEALAKAQGVSVDELIRQKYAFEGNASAADAAVAKYHAFIGAQNDATKAVRGLNEVLYDQATALMKASDSATRSAAIKDLQETFAEAFKNNPNLGVKTFKDFINEVPELKQKIEDQKNYNRAFKEFGDYLDLTPQKAKKTKSEFESLTDGVRKLSAEVDSYRNMTSKEFQLRFQKEELERTKRDFEKIIDLRRELGLPIAMQMPSGAEATRGEIEHLESVKKLRDNVLQVMNETREAEEKLTVARITAGAKVVESETRANTAYLESIRERRNAEAQLTADLANEFRKRADFTNNFLKQTELAQADALKTALQEKTNEDTERLKMIARLQVLSGEVFSDNPLVQAAAAIASKPPEVSPVVARLDKSNQLLQEILNAVNASGMSGAGSVSGGSFGGGNALRVTSGRGDLDALYRKYGAQFGVDPNILLEQGRQESINFKASVLSGQLRSPKGAGGIAQFMPDTARRFGVDITSVESSIQGQAKYMRLLLDKFNGDYRLALAGYNAGEGRDKFKSSEARLNYFLQNVAETRNYVPTIMSKAGGIQPTVINRPVVARQPKNSRIGGTWVATGGMTSDAPEPSGTPSLYSSLGATPDDFSNGFFKLNSDSSFLSKDSLGSLQTYLEALREYKELGKSDAERNQNLKLQAIGQDRINQLINVRFKQMGELAAVEARINNLIKGDSVAVREVLNESELSRRREYEGNLKTLIATNALLDKLRAGDSKEIGRLITSADAERATATAKAYGDIAKAKSFLEKYAAGDAKVLEYLQKTREAQRAGEIVGLTTEIDRLRELSKNGGRDSQIENLTLEKERLTVIVSVGQATARLDQLETLRADKNVVRAKQTADILNEEYDLRKRLADLEDERATIGANRGLRMQAAAEDERNSILREREKAQEDAARARVRLENSTVLDTDTANAAVLKHISSIKSLTEIYADAKIGIVDKFWGGIDTLTEKLFSKLPVVGSIFQGIVSNILKLVANQFVVRLLGLDNVGKTGGGVSGSPSASSSGGSTSGVLSILQQAITGGGSGSGGYSTPPFNPNTTQFANFGGNTSVSGGGLQVGSFSQVLNALGGSKQFTNIFGGNGSDRPDLTDVGSGGGTSGVVSGASGGLFGKVSKWLGLKQGSGITGALAGALPFLGLGAGNAIGGGSGLGGILGSGGGLIGGLLGSALLTGSASTLFGGVFAGANAAAGTAAGALSIGGLSAAMSATVVLAPIAAALLIGSYFLKRNSVRRKEETASEGIRVGAKEQLQKILEDLRKSSNPADIENAMTQANQIRANYLTEVGKLTDKKTRTHAQAFVRELDAIIAQISTEGANVQGRARKSDFAEAYDNAIVPTFDGGGIYSTVANSPAMWRRSANDTVFAYNPNTEAILTRQNIYAMGGYGALGKAGVTGASYYQPVATRQAEAYGTAATSYGGTRGNAQTPTYNVIVFGDKAAKEMTEKLDGRGIINIIKPLVYSGQDDGFVDSIEGRMAGDF